ncbi:hypothetical protein BN1723_018091, partial [Verticillium longisporum]
MCATFNITKSAMTVIQRELQRGCEITDNVMLSKRPWGDLFIKHTFFTSGYKYYISVVTTSTTKEAHKIWSGYVESKVRVLVQGLEQHQSIAIAHAFNKGYDRRHVKLVSRRHARIFFNSEDESWFLEVIGRNGVKANNSPLKQGTSRPLQSGEVLDVGGTEMMFVLPTEISTLHIHPIYLKRLGIPKQDVTSPIPPPSAAGPSDEPPSSQPASSGRSQPFRQPIAPAPPDYKRPGTPPSARSKVLSAQHKSPGYSSSGTLLLSANDVDLSQDDNRHIKPQFSY